jgi:2-polyprenyl-3-methyl-5-hydroxy-6-metoxy-1,4-benzoquinol methylase
MLYAWKVRLLKRPLLNRIWRRWVSRRGRVVGNYADLPRYVKRFVPGRSFADIGCMWGVNGEYAFVAERAGAVRVVGVDVFGPTPEFEERHAREESRVEFVLGDIASEATLERVGEVDVVLCAGVLYHHPSPFDLLVALRRICRETLILRTSTIPEIPGLPHAAVFYPMLDARARRSWNLSSLGVGRQVGISDAFQPEEGYGNWFWGLSPSCVTALLAVAGFRVRERAEEAFAQTFVCDAVAPPFHHALPSADGARQIGAAVSAAGVARPA